MPKLPDIEYAVVSQGPPNSAQAWNAAAGAMAQLGQIGHQATMAFAEEQAKTQMSEASLIVEQGLADTETKLQKPYLTPDEVRSAFPNGVPPDIATVLERHQDPAAPSVPTYEVGASIHSEVAKRLAGEATPLIYSAKVRSEFERRFEAESMRRNARVTMSMMSQGAELNAARDVSRAEARARTAVSPGDWAKVYAEIENSGWLSPAQKEKYATHFAGLQETQGKQRTAAGLAEGALAAGRDDLTPWVDAGKAQAAFEKSVEGKDPLVVEAARQKFTQALDQAEKMRKLSDADSLGQLEVTLRRTGALDRTSPIYEKLSSGGKATIEHIAQQERLRKTTATAEAKASAKMHGDTRFALFDMQDARTKAEADVSREAWKDVDDLTWAKAVKAKRDAGLNVAKDNGLGADQRKKLITDEIVPLNQSPGTTALFVSHVEARIAREFTKDKPPTNEDVLRIVADETLMGTSKYRWIDDTEARWQAETNEKRGANWTADPMEKQPEAVRSMAERGKPLPSSTPVAPAPAPVAGQPKQGDKVDGRQIGLTPGRLFEHTGRTDPQTGRVIWKVVK